jgi:hypothetical protein
MRPTLAVGIDPGISGGIAALDMDGAVVVLVKMPATDADTAGVFGQIMRAGCVAHAVIERVWSSPQMGVRSAFTFGRNYGGLLMLLAGCRLHHSEITPQKWQAAMGCLSRGDKNVTKRRAQQLFPDHARAITHATADALLIAEYCRRGYYVTEGVRP